MLTNKHPQKLKDNNGCGDDGGRAKSGGDSYVEWRKRNINFTTKLAEL